MQAFQSGTIPVTLKGWSMLQYHKILQVHNPTSIYRLQNYTPMQWYPLPLGRLADTWNYD